MKNENTQPEQSIPGFTQSGIQLKSFNLLRHSCMLHSYHFQKTLCMATLLIFLFGCGSQSGDESSADSNHTDQISNQVISASKIKNGTKLVQNCLQCHNKTAITNDPLIPNINGQVYSYLLSSIQSYKTSQRKHDKMADAVSLYSEPEIVYLATHFSNLKPEWPVLPITRTASRKAVEENQITTSINQGKQKAESCFACHGENGNSTKPGIPSLAGLNRWYIEYALLSYLEGERKNEYMKVFKHFIDKDTARNLAIFFSNQDRIKTKMQGNGDLSKGNELATNQCRGCHGIQGNSLEPDFPSLSGQNFQYLVTAIKSYVNGNRKNKLMTDSVSGLKEKDINNLASYYANQVPQNNNTSKPDGSIKNSPMKYAEQLSANCVNCHGNDAITEIPGSPKLTGLSADYIIDSLQMYIDGKRQHKLMKYFSSRLSEMERELVGFYFASLQPPNTNITSNLKIATPEKAASCEACHGQNGNSSNKNIPSIAGQNSNYLMQTLKYYKNGLRQNNDMKKAVELLTDREIKALSGYFANQPSTGFEISLPQPPEMLTAKCVRCHYVPDNGNTPSAPIISHQPYPYLKQALLEYKTGKRENSAMFAMTDGLTLWEIDALAQYYSQNQKKPPSVTE